jgi:hypothetical protein
VRESVVVWELGVARELAPAGLRSSPKTGKCASSWKTASAG